MCYNECEHFRFNPMEGEGRCVAKRGQESCLICDTCGEHEDVCFCKVDDE